jgi:hypothetical protein
MTMPITIVALSIAVLLSACTSTPERTTRPMAAAGAAGFRGEQELAGSPASLTPPATLIPEMRSDAEPTAASADCSGGKYTGNYEAELWGIGPITFELGQPAVKAAGCQEFCPDLKITEGSSFEVMWVARIEGSFAIESAVNATGTFAVMR